MRTILGVFSALTVLLSHGTTEAQSPSTKLTPETFATWHASLQPGEEAWTTIPWQVSLAPAQQLAVKEGKPLFVWAMDGHPLGCT